MKKILLICCFLIAALALPSLASANENAVGLSFGPTRGTGFAYRTIDYGTGIGYQFAGLPLVGPDEGLVMGGASALYVLHKGSRGIAYVSIGIAGAYGWDDCTSDDEADCKDDSGYGYSFGPGIGAEFRFLDNFGLALELPLAVHVADSQFAGLYPIPNTSLVYFW